MRSGKKVMTLGAIVVLVSGLILGGMTLTQDDGKKSEEHPEDQAAQMLEQLYRRISVVSTTPVRGQVDLSDDAGVLLPEISKYPLQVENTTDDFVEIFASTEKAGAGTDGWLVKVAEAFNSTGYRVNGKPVSVRLRGIASGLGADFIASGKYRPDAFSPSNELWGEMLKARGVTVTMVEKRLVGNVAGVLLSMDKYKELIEKHGEIDLNAVTQAVRENRVAMGYTNPFASSAGLNFLVSSLYTFDKKDPLSDKAVSAFEHFQMNIPLVAYTTLQLRDAAGNGTLDGFILEYQSYSRMPDIHANYMFTPFGVRHDSPLYAIGDISALKTEILRQFALHCKNSQSQQLGRDYGFNARESYHFDLRELEGNVVVQAQKLWKEKKDGGNGVAAVFVIDLSGSMAGQRLNRLKESLLRASKKINSEDAVGIVTFADEVSVALPVGKFDFDQRSMLTGTVQAMQASGGTSMYDAIVVAAKLLLDVKAARPEFKLMILVLTDGESNQGLGYGETKEVLARLKIPIYTIGYEADVPALKQLSELSEATSINADADDVLYKLESFFNAQM
jgi:Ca-activated chloride channel family protein